MGSYGVKLVAISGSRRWAGEAVIGANEPNADRRNAPETVARAIHACLADAQLSARALRGVTMGISGPDVIVKQIAMPLLEDDEVPQALRYEARKHLPFDPEGMIVDYQILRRSQEDKRLDLLLAAVSQQHVERHLEPLRLVGLDSQLLDAAPLALTNSVVSATETAPAVLLDMGHQASHFTLHQPDEPYFSRRLDFGGWHLTRAVAENLRIPFEEAERWKIEASEANTSLDWNAPEMRAMLDAVRAGLVDELRRSLAFYRTVAALPDELKVWVSGSSARLPGLGERLTELLALPVTVFDPLAMISHEHVEGNAQGGPQFALAYGLALRAA